MTHAAGQHQPEQRQPWRQGRLVEREQPQRPKTGIQQTADFAETLYQYLLDNDGECNLGDKSEADDIYERFHVSKKVYKRAIGDLYKKRLITVSPMSIRLAE